MTKNSDKQATEPLDIEEFLELKSRLETMMNEKFTRFLTVMFTDLKGSTSIAETEGDLVSRMLIKQHNDIVMPAISSNQGVFIKSIGDGTLSYFDNAQDAVRAAVRIQQGMDTLNMRKSFKIPVLMRIGLHSGKCIVEKNDIFGDTVNTASRFESSANPGDIFMSEDTYNALSDKSEVYCRFIKQVSLKGKKEPYNAYKAFWNPQEVELDKALGDQPRNSMGRYHRGEVELDKALGDQPTTQPKPTSKLKLALIVAIPFTIVLLLSLWQPNKDALLKQPAHSIEHAVDLHK